MKAWDCIIVEDEPFAISLLVKYISERDELNLVGIAEEGNSLLTLLRERNAEIIFLDMKFPAEPGFLNDTLMANFLVVVVVSAIPWNMYDKVFKHPNLFELPKPISCRLFNRCLDSIVSHLRSKTMDTNDT